MKAALRIAGLVLVVLSLPDIPGQLAHLRDLISKLLPYATPGSISTTFATIGLSLLLWTTFERRLLQAVGVLGSIQIRFPRYEALKDDPPLTTFEPPMRWGVRMICRAWRIEVRNTGRKAIGELGALISGRGRLSPLPVQRSRLGFLESPEPYIALRPGEAASIEVAFALDSRISHSGSSRFGENEVGLCLLDRQPPLNRALKTRYDAVIEIRSSGISPVTIEIVMYQTRSGDLVLIRRPSWPTWLLSKTLRDSLDNRR